MCPYISRRTCRCVKSLVSGTIMRGLRHTNRPGPSHLLSITFLCSEQWKSGDLINQPLLFSNS